MSDDETFEKGDAGASHTFPSQAGSLKKGGYIVIKGKACKVNFFFLFVLFETLDCRNHHLQSGKAWTCQGQHCRSRYFHREKIRRLCTHLSQCIGSKCRQKRI